MPKPGSILYDTIRINGKEIRAAAPVIVSASRATDIPAFKGDWFFNQLEKGFVERINPFNQKKYYISLKNASVFVFWSKNPEPFLAHLLEFKSDFYIQFTLNNYDGTGLEPHVPSMQKRIDTFKLLVDRYGKGRILWRFDPIMITPEMPLDNVLERINRIAHKLKGYTNRLTFSFLTLKSYRASKERLSKAFNVPIENVNTFVPSIIEQFEILQFLSALQNEWQNENPEFSVEACAMPNDYSQYRISYARCIDDKLLRKLFHDNRKLMEFLGDENTVIKGDPSQRKNCQCVPSKDIGAYNTCDHGCLYCYANK